MQEPDAAGFAVRSDEPDFYRILGRAIRVLRAERGLERKDLALRAGTSYPYLSEIEAGKKRPSAHTLLALAQALDVRPHELIALAESLALREQPASVERTAPPAAQPAAASRTSPVSEPAGRPREAEAFPAASPPAPPRPARFFHAADGPAAPLPVEPLAAPPTTPASPAASWQAAPPRTVSAVLRELRHYLERMAPDDLQRILDLARRLSR
jgi:transcriptional regulator with XRE-family HTH domain